MEKANREKWIEPKSPVRPDYFRHETAVDAYQSGKITLEAHVAARTADTALDAFCIGLEWLNMNGRSKFPLFHLSHGRIMVRMTKAGASAAAARFDLNQHDDYLESIHEIACGYYTAKKMFEYNIICKSISDLVAARADFVKAKVKG